MVLYAGHPYMMRRLSSPRFSFLSIGIAGYVLRQASAMSTSTSKYKGAVVFLHGLGDSPAGWSSIEQVLPSICPSLQDKIKYSFPAAPIIPITINGGMQMPGWFDLYDWPIAVGSKDDEEGLLRSVSQIEEAVEKIQRDEGIPKSKIVVGGFSQGGAAALLAAYRAKGKDKTFEPYAGCVGLSAWLTLPESLQVPQEAAEKTPLLWCHGRFDDKVLFEQQSFGVGKLRESGVKVKDTFYDIGHESHPEEMAAFADFLEAALLGDGENPNTGSEL